jgi:hypothetical protein
MSRIYTEDDQAKLFDRGLLYRNRMATLSAARLPDDGMIDLGFDSEGEEYNAQHAANAAGSEPAPDVDKPYENQNTDKLGDGLPDAVAVTGENSTEQENVPKPLKKKRKRPKLDEDRLTGREGLEALAPAFCRTLKTDRGDKDFPGKQTFSGTGREGDDLRRLLQNYRRWAKSMAPFLSFEDVIDKCEKIGGKLSVREHVQSMRYWTGQYAHHEKERARILLRIRNSLDLEDETDARGELKDLDLAWEDLLATRESDFQNAQQVADDEEDNFIVGDNDYDRLQEQSATVTENEKALASAEEITRKREAAERRLQEKKNSMAAQYDEFGNDDDLFADIDLSAYASPAKSTGPEETVVAGKAAANITGTAADENESVSPSTAGSQAAGPDSLPATVLLTVDDDDGEAQELSGEATPQPQSTVALVATQPVVSSDEETFPATVPLEMSDEMP